MARRRPVVFDIGNVLVRWDPGPAIATAVGSRRAEAFLADEAFGFAGWNHAMDEGRGPTWAEAERDAMRRFPHYAEEIVAYRRNFTTSLVGAVDGTAEIVHELHRGEVPLYALTNWSAELWHHAPERFEVLHLFDDIIVSGVEGVAKPDPRIWEVLADRMGRGVAGVTFVDDSPRNVESALAAGMDAILFTGAVDLRAALRARGHAL